MQLQGGTPNSLNEYQKNHLLVTVQHVDKLLSDIEEVLAASTSKSPFPKYANEIAPTQRKVIEDYLARIRAQMIRVIDSQRIPVPSPQFDSGHSIRTALICILVALDDLRPKAMRGYGEVPQAAVSELNGLVAELAGLIEKLGSYLAPGNQDLQSRLVRLDQTFEELELLKILEAVITRQGLVEFRQSLSIILDRLEEKSFEVAFFGRVSSGKSSLLNYLLETQVLPVGVTPVTAVPTRIGYGAEPRVIVRFANRPAQQFEVQRLAEFVAEQQNPANAKRITRVLVRLPSEKLRDGVVFVDTPGLGSLATTGAAETLAYLPRCDLGVTLVDAGSTLTREDLDTIRLLYEAAIPTMVLLSKADLLSPDDRERAMQYIAAHIRSDLGLDIPVHPVSVMTEEAALLDRWFEKEIVPLYGQYQELAAKSIRRKIGSLRETISAALKLRLEVAARTEEDSDEKFREAETTLRRAAGKFEEVRLACEEIVEAIEDLTATILDRAVPQVAEHLSKETRGDADISTLVASAVVQVSAEKAAQIHTIFRGLAGFLADSLNETASALNLRERPTQQELLSGLEEMPRLDVGDIRINLHKTFRIALGLRMAQSYVKDQLRTQAGQVISDACSAYSRLIDSWTSASLRQLRKRFDAFADVYRAQLATLLKPEDASEQRLNSIRGDWDLMENWQRGADVTVQEHSN